jgi:hypothetical protein
MIVLKNKANNQLIGNITEQQLQFLVDALEEESSNDQDYWLNVSMIDIMEQNGADAAMIVLLRTAMGSDEEIEIVWSKSE